MSASSNIMSLYPFENSVLVSANCLICSRTTSIPLSSEAFSYQERALVDDLTGRNTTKYLKDLFSVIGSVYSTRNSKNSRGFTSSRRSIE